MKKPPYKTALKTKFPSRTGTRLRQIGTHTAVNENAIDKHDDLYHELELRYGSGFAQAIVDGLNK
jgi:hypothetical protein